jgi:flagellar motility protein MotE (MotC chaperone)
VETTPSAGFAEVAVRSAAPFPSMPVVHLPWSKAARMEAEAASVAGNGERPVPSGVDADRAPMPAAQETAAGNGWWREILTLTRLPVPVLGVQQVAHAAAMDTPPPPPPARPSATGMSSPFAPPEQAQVRSATPIPSGQDPSGAPLPLRPRPNASQAGSAMPTTRGAGAPAPSAAVTGIAPVPSAKAFQSPDSPEIKQQELARREQDVLLLKQQMESRLQELQSAEKKVQGMLKEAHGVHEQKIKHLISSYTNMKPKQAALALESLEERLAVRILAGMNPKQAGEVLTYTNPQKVAKLTELLARMQLPGE